MISSDVNLVGSNVRSQAIIATSCGGFTDQVDENPHEVTIPCAMDLGSTYTLYVALDYLGSGVDAFIAFEISFTALEDPPTENPTISPTFD